MFGFVDTSKNWEDIFFLIRFHFKLVTITVIKSSWVHDLRVVLVCVGEIISDLNYSSIVAFDWA